MRTSSGFDRIATEEELHQVLALLQKTADGWVLSEDFDDSGDEAESDLILCDDDVESLAEFAARTPELKN